MIVAFRADASVDIGSGHVMRCLTLADELKRQGADCHFIMRPLPGALTALVESRGHRVERLPELDDRLAPEPSDAEGPAHSHWLAGSWRQDAADTGTVVERLKPDWLVVDHYGIEARWERVLKAGCARLMAIDDLADRAHDCDLLLDQNLGREPEDYRRWVPANCQLMTGPSFALLRPEFRAWRDRSLARRRGSSEPLELLINLGGVDRENLTGHLLARLSTCPIPAHTRITVVMGQSAPRVDEVKSRARQMPWITDVRVGVSNMAEIMAHSDLAIGAAGGTSWERCCLGLPALLVVMADNQRAGANALAERGAALLLGDSWADATLLCRGLGQALEQAETLSSRAASVCDGAGAQRVVKKMMEL
ncbi:UDP-2,4-diacetamido-2,4,6-trideoxy-beta-L-altropyranose hydrolase [Marinobacter daqiaonensis]|uniref:UDP-2,4-diacetamido-2,4,6-trideoxy-beta-L-altropyranose hydrolase n=1 Tax=Marinobacter daqiaonensis TaxID=650891 RepID=A0A1I6K2I7_9GAMM|nr:UDP-2,4-diacetamido-2,4,6-trideoxy-beta-L-altropyranose hydrolase [Marinobacter daqiaonensis]SFR85298.1 UDP-2,4-diacetamido-2,4,6-trideoxy-beta-L-altropyranose hydrolase [Marinobacter daqiaonensis]